MEFFETFWTWLDGALQNYIATNTQRIANALAPAVEIFGFSYVMIWGYMQLTGRIEQPWIEGLTRIIKLAVIFGIALHLWLYNDLLVDTFYNAPAQLAGAIVGADDPVTVIDAIWARGAMVAENLASRTTWRSGWDFTIMAYIIRFMIGTLCVYTMFLIALSKVALSVLLALGPLFIVMLLFDATRHYFMSWIAQLSNYALITILTVMVCAFILGLVQKYTTDTLGLGVGVRTVDALNMLLVCALAILFMMQVTQIAGSLSGGGAGLNTFGSGRWAYGKSRNAALRARRTTVGIGVVAVGSARNLISRLSNSPKARQNIAGADSPETQSGRARRNSIEQGH